MILHTGISINVITGNSYSTLREFCILRKKENIVHYVSVSTNDKAYNDKTHQVMSDVLNSFAVK